MSENIQQNLTGAVSRSDMKKMMRLGKYTSSTAATGNTSSSLRPRPLLIQFRDRIIKNQVMESLFNLKGKEDRPIYSKLIFAHDLTPRERKECKQLVQDAKKQERTLRENGNIG